ncbi:MAG: HDIG domain-containing protein [Ignavibacteriae bacterium]|nr:HDIG domain-containing protein [Ignavibacteriota bacterium]
MTNPQELLEKYIKNENLRKHCYAVETCMKFYANKLGEDEDKWGAVGLLHDLDWEMYPDTHPNTAVPILEEAGFDKEFIDAVLGHAYPERTDVARETPIAKYLFACDEITGLVTAYSYMKPGGLNEVQTKGVIKKMKDKGFARNIEREGLTRGAEDIGLEIREHIDNIIEAMRSDERLK